MAYIIAPIEILRNAYDNPQGFKERCEVLQHRRTNEPLPERLIVVAAYLETLPKSNCKVQISYSQIDFLNNLLGEEVYQETRQRRILVLLGHLALRSIQGMRTDYVRTDNKILVSRMAGFNTWNDYSSADNVGTLGVLKEYPNRTLADFCEKLRKSIEETFDYVKFRPSANNRGWEFTTKREKLKI